MLVSARPAAAPSSDNRKLSDSSVWMTRPAAGAKRRSDGQLVLTGDRARQKQTGNIDRSDQQDEAEQDEQHDRKQPEPDGRAAELHRIGGKHLRGPRHPFVHLRETGVRAPRRSPSRPACARSRVPPGASLASTLNVWTSAIVQGRQRQRADRHVRTRRHEAGDRSVVLRQHAGQP